MVSLTSILFLRYQLCKIQVANAHNETRKTDYEKPMRSLGFTPATAPPLLTPRYGITSGRLDICETSIVDL